jgi:hypothetical protein
MHFQFLLSGPHGDIKLSPEDLERPFLTNPSEKHAFLTLEDYFGALKQFITHDDGNLLRSALKKQNPHKTATLTGLSDVLICSEKHGAFYHIARIVLIGLEQKVQFAVTTALSGSAKVSLKEEFLVLQQLAAMNPDFLPEVYCSEMVTWETSSGADEFCMVLGEWLDGYHEWHVSIDPASNMQRIQLWDYENGYRFLADAECGELLRQAAYILTCYYDRGSFCQISPWHHGAGDFVLKAEPGIFSVKLITARQYEPLVHFDAEEGADRLVAAIHYLLNLVLRIRLDRIDGVGEPAWLESFAVHAAVAGFFAALADSQNKDRLTIGPVGEFLEIMQSFDTGEIYDMYESLLEIYAEEDQDDFRLIKEKLADHAAELHQALQVFSLNTP